MPPNFPRIQTNSLSTWERHASCSTGGSIDQWIDQTPLRRFDVPMLRPLTVTTLVLTCADHWTTYLCLRSPIVGWNVVEANPVVAQLFQGAGLVGGLLIDSLFTVFALGFILYTRRFSTQIKQAFLSLIVLATSYAVVNNFRAISELGISPLGVG
jgi:hypothetical protein